MNLSFPLFPCFDWLFDIMRVVFSACVSLAYVLKVDAAVDFLDVLQWTSWTKPLGRDITNLGRFWSRALLEAHSQPHIESCQPPDFADEEMVRLSQAGHTATTDKSYRSRMAGAGRGGARRSDQLTQGLNNNVKAHGTLPVVNLNWPDRVKLQKIDEDRFEVLPSDSLNRPLKVSLLLTIYNLLYLVSR